MNEYLHADGSAPAEIPADWPHADCSRFVDTGDVRWHVQEMGQGPTLLLLHGTGAFLHSWSELMTLLAQSHHVIAVDLPGQGGFLARADTVCFIAGDGQCLCRSAVHDGDRTAKRGRRFCRCGVAGAHVS